MSNQVLSSLFSAVEMINLKKVFTVVSSFSVETIIWKKMLGGDFMVLH